MAAAVSAVVVSVCSSARLFAIGCCAAEDEEEEEEEEEEEADEEDDRDEDDRDRDDETDCGTFARRGKRCAITLDSASASPWLDSGRMILVLSHLRSHHRSDRIVIGVFIESRISGGACLRTGDR
jgi:hypothetical protein